LDGVAQSGSASRSCTGFDDGIKVLLRTGPLALRRTTGVGCQQHGQFHRRRSKARWDEAHRLGKEKVAAHAIGKGDGPRSGPWGRAAVGNYRTRRTESPNAYGRNGKEKKLSDSDGDGLAAYVRGPLGTVAATVKKWWKTEKGRFHRALERRHVKCFWHRCGGSGTGRDLN